MSLLKLSGIFLAFLSALLGGAYPFIKKSRHLTENDFPVASSLAAGIFLGIGLIHMLGEASSEFYRLGYEYPLAPFLTGIIFLVLLWLEHMSREMHLSHEECDQQQESKRQESGVGFALLALITLSIHSFLAGLALGISQSLTMPLVLLLAILAHKWAASFSLAIQINKSRLNLHQGILLFLIFALMTPLGVITGNYNLYHFRHTLFEPVFQAMAAGTFIYLGTLHGLNRAIMVRRCCGVRIFRFFVTGFAIMAGLALYS